jgi:hypothetical protein
MSRKYNIIGVDTCEPCGHPHGPLYVCPHYSPEKQAEIRAKSQQFSADLRDPKWVAEQKSNGIPQSVIDIYKIFDGGEE